MINELSINLQGLLEKNVKKLAKESKFVTRNSKLSGEKFAKGLIFGWQNNPDSTLSNLKQSLETFGVNVSEQALNKRFSAESAKFIELLLNQAMSILTRTSKVSSGILTKLSDLKVYDSSIITLPVELIEHWTGTGGNKGSKSNSAIKLSVCLSLNNRNWNVGKY